VVKKAPFSSLGGALAALGNSPQVTAGGEPVPVVDAPKIAGEDAPQPAAAVMVAMPRPPRREIWVPSKRRAALPIIPPDALAAALLLARLPSLAQAAREQALPPDILSLIRVAAGSPETLRRSVHLTGKDPTFIRAAAVYYLEQVLWTDESDHYRVLGLMPGASRDRVAEHTRWLMRWLLPYLGGSQPESAQFERVLTAWGALKTSEERTFLERTFLARGAASDPAAGAQPVPVARASSAWPRWQIAAIAAVGIAAIGVVAMSGRISLPPLAGLATNAQPPGATAGSER